MIKVITIDSFKGGRTNFQDQSLVPPDVCASGSMNVWAPEGGLIKAPGMVLQSSFTASGAAGCPGFWADDTVSTANTLFYRLTLSATGGGSSNYYPFGSNSFTDALNVLGYTTGTVSISGASLISATGSGTLWLANVVTGDRFNVSTTANAFYSIKSVEDNTHLTLDAAVPAAVATGTGYTIQPGMQYLEMAAGSLNGNFLWSVTATGTVNAMQLYDGTGVRRLAAGPNAAYLAVFKNYMFAANTVTAQSRVYWSTIKDPTSWPTNNFVDVDVLNGKISGLYSYGQELIVFKTRGMYKIIGDVFDPSNPQYYVLKIATPPDFVFDSAYSCAIHRGILTFYGGGRIYQYRLGTLTVTDISRNIIRDLPTAFGVVYNAHANVDQRIQAISFNDYYIIKGFQDPNNSGQYACLILDHNMSWWYFSDRDGQTTTANPFDIGKMAIFPSTTTRPQLAIAMNTYGHIFTWDFIGPVYGNNFYDTAATGVSSTTDIKGTWISKEFNIEYGTFKTIAIYLLKQTAGNLTVQWSIDQGTAVSYTIDMTKGRGQIIRAIIPIQQKGSTIQLTLTNNTAGQPFKVFGIKIYYEESMQERVL